MKLALNFSANIYRLMRQCGYHFERKDKEELVFSRIISQAKSGYPRFHIYAKAGEVSRQTIINIHLDQKKPSYKGTSAHAAEYDSTVVKEEVARIKQVLGL